MKLELGFIDYGKAEQSAVADIMRTTNVAMGQNVSRFEAMFAEYVGVRNAVMVTSGSTANLLAVSAMVEAGVMKPGQEVKVPALTWATTLWPVVQNGMSARLVDCDRRTLNTELPEKGSFAVHLLGNASQDRADLEDCCESLGVFISGHHVGSKAMAATFSFYVSHHITTMEGGMVTCFDDDFADLLRSMRSHGWTRHTKMAGVPYEGIDPRFLFIHPGYNFRPMEIQGALGCLQLPKLDGWNKRRNEIYAAMRKAMEPLGLFDFIETTPGAKPAWFCFPVLMKRGNPKALMAHLEARGIQTRPILAGNLGRHPAVKVRGDIVSDPLPNADYVMDNGLYWGCHPGVDDAQIAHLVESVEMFLDKKEAA